MKNVMEFLVLNGGFAAAVWFGFIEGIEGAQYIAMFFVWAVSVPLGLLALTDTIQKKLATEPKRPFRRSVVALIAWFALGVFVWNGHIATAVAWGFWIFSGAIAREGAKKHRAENARLNNGLRNSSPEPSV